MNQTEFLHDFYSLLEKHNIFVSGNLSIVPREKYTNNESYIVHGQSAKIEDVIHYGDGTKNSAGPFLTTQIDMETKPVHLSETNYGGPAIVGKKGMLNFNKKVPSDFKNLINNINKVHKGVGGF